jgi:glycine/D-amino acid oxidase-like deaminating enzyme
MLEEEHRIARQFGFSATMNKGKQLPFAPSGWFAVNNQAKFHPLKFLRGVTSAIESSGGKLFEHSKVLSLEPTAGGGVAIKTAGGNITAKDVVIATYVPFNNPKTVAYKKAMYATYVLEVQIPPKTFSEGLFWDCDSPYHYFRIDRGRKFDRMIVGGEDHRADVPINKNKSFAALEEYLAGLLLGKRYTIVRRWVGGVLESVDGIPFIGAYEPHQFVATAFSGNGMTYAMIAASIFRDLIVKKRASKDIWMHVFDPKRSFTLYRLVKKGMDYGEEFFGGAVKNTLRER